MKTTKKEVVAKIRQYIQDAISVEGFDGEFPDLGSKLALVVSECKHGAFFPDNIKRFGSYQKAFIDWLWGLPSCLGGFDYDTFRVLELMESWGLPLPSNKDETDAVELYGWLIYREFSNLCKIHKIQFPV